MRLDLRDQHFSPAPAEFLSGLYDRRQLGMKVFGPSKIVEPIMLTSPGQLTLHSPKARTSPRRVLLFVQKIAVGRCGSSSST